MFRMAFSVLLLLATLPAWAGDGDAARRAIQATAPTRQVLNFRASALPGYYEGVVDGAVVYASADGRYLIRGTVERIGDARSLSEDSLAALRRQKLAELGPESRLSYAPEHPKYRVTVFTDVDCPYCRRFHTQIADYNRVGIAVDYVFFPLDIHPGAAAKSVAVWCAADRLAAYNAAMAGHDPGGARCAAPVDATRRLGNDLGVTSTPTVIAPDGSVLPSSVLMSPARLAAELERLRATPGAVAATAPRQSEPAR